MIPVRTAPAPRWALSVSLAAATASLSAQTWQQATPAVAPPARESASNWMAYDPVRGVSALFGGNQGTATALADTWEWNGVSWTLRTPTVAPAGRWAHGMVQDTLRRRAVMFGGFVANGGQFSNETWEWDGSVWQLASPALSPSARGYFGMAFDSVRNKVVVFGGHDGTSLLGDTWQFDGVTWEQLPSGPAPSVRQGAAMAFDARRGETVLFGGKNGTVTLGDTWTFNGVSWQQRTPATSPLARQSASMCADNLAGTVLLFGGADFSNTSQVGDSWTWDGATWTQMSGTGPSARSGAAMAFDVQLGKTVLFGGRQSAGNSSETWEIASPERRTMSTLTLPAVGQTASFQYSYPTSAAGHFYGQILSTHMIGSFPVQWPGVAVLGEARVNPQEILALWMGFLDNSGSLVTTINVPNNPIFEGLAFDVQALDNDLNGTSRFATNDVEVRVGQGASGATSTGAVTTGQAQVISAGQGIEIDIPSGAMAVDSPVVVEVDTTPPAWATDVNYTAAPIEVSLTINPDALLTDDGIEIEIPIGAFPIDELDPTVPGALNGSVFLYVAPGVGVAIPTRLEVVTSANGVVSFRRLVGRIGRGLAGFIRTAARTTVNVVSAVGRTVVAVTVFSVTIVVRAVCSVLSPQTPQLNLLQWDESSNGWVAYSPPTSALGRVAFLVHGVQFFGDSRQLGQQQMYNLGGWMAYATMPFDGSRRLYDRVYCIRYHDDAGVAAIGAGIRSLVSGISANEYDMVGYSMGGLVIRNAAELRSSPAWNTANQKISRIVTIGTPHEGTLASSIHTVAAALFAPIIAGCWAQHIADCIRFSAVTTSLALSGGSGSQTRYYAFAGTRPTGFAGGAGVFVGNFLLIEPSDGFIPRSSALSNTLTTKGDLRLRQEVFLNHDELMSDSNFHQNNVLPILFEDRYGSTPTVDFTATVTSGIAPLVVQFQNASLPGSSTTWRWDFNNDGVVDSTLRNPTYTYTQSGTYTVRLDATYAGVQRTLTRSNYIFCVATSADMVRIEAGTFQMGSTAPSGAPYYGQLREQPVHPVTITRPFLMGRYEVTQAEYQAVMGTNPSSFQGASWPNSQNRPVESVSWNDAMAYCATLTARELAAGRLPSGYQYRLPTEAEWEYCCRAGTTTEFHYGPTLLCGQANFYYSYHSNTSCNFSSTVVVGGYAPNAWGLHDMHGNVWEWCLDSWDGSANYPSAAVTDPFVSSGPDRVIRGGGWGNVSDYCRSAYRVRYLPSYRYYFFGFRVVLAPVLVP